MCNFFSFVTEPEGHGGQRFYFDWNDRKENLKYEHDSHSIICEFYKLDEDKCNKYEFNPLTKKFEVDQINSSVDDTAQAHEWVENLDFKRIVEPLVIKPIINPFLLPAVETVTDEQIAWLKQWDSVSASVGVSVSTSVRDSVRDSVSASAGDSVWDSVRAYVRDFVWDSVGVSVRAYVRASVGVSVRAYVRDSVSASVGVSISAYVSASVWAYISTFFNIHYEYDFSPCIKLWEAGIVPSYDGTTWRLHTGKDAHVVYEWEKKG